LGGWLVSDRDQPQGNPRCRIGRPADHLARGGASYLVHPQGKAARWLSLRQELGIVWDRNLPLHLDGRVGRGVDEDAGIVGGPPWPEPYAVVHQAGSACPLDEEADPHLRSTTVLRIERNILVASFDGRP